MDDWETIQQVRAAVADIDRLRLRVDMLQLIHESNALLRQIDRTNTPLIDSPTADEQR
jgi:hypothetical protein